MTNTLDNILHLLNENSRRIATLISIVLIVLMSLTVADSVLFVLENSDTAPVDRSSTIVNKITAPGKTNYQVSNLELFGKLENVSNPSPIIDAPKTQLNLELQGVFIADVPEHSTAIVAEKNKSGELFTIGDRLPGNAILSAVNHDHVLLKRGTRVEKLMFSDSEYRSASPDSGSGSGSDANNVSAARASRQSDINRLRERIRNNTNLTPNIATPNQPASQALTEYRQKLEDDPVAALGEAGISAVSEGESMGYKVGADANGMIKQAGLQSGDVIVSVNGRPVGDATNDTALMDQVMASSRVRVEVQRGARRFFLTVPVPK